MSDIPPISALAAEAGAHFTTTRGDETIVTLRDDAPDWVRNLVYRAHGDMLPDDYRYRWTRDALECIEESGEESRDDLDDYAGEFADTAVDVYTGARLAWLASHLSRPGYCDEAADDLGADGLDTVERIGLGQYVESREVFELVANALEDEREARADD